MSEPGNCPTQGILELPFADMKRARPKLIGSLNTLPRQAGRKVDVGHGSSPLTATNSRWRVWILFFGGNVDSLQDSGTARGDPRVALIAQQAKEIFHANNQNP